jgi:predicted site-specific integrase-resolvase
MDMMCVTRVTIYNWMKNGWIMGFKVNGDWRFTEDQVRAIMKRKGVPYGEES